MRRFVAIAAAAACIGFPAHAAGWQTGGQEVHTGAFAGVRLRLPLGTSVPARPQAALTLSLTQFRSSTAGRTMTLVGEGVALDFARRKPMLTVGGVPADRAMGLRQQGNVDAHRKLGISTGGWIAIGVVVAAGAVLAITQLTCVGKDKDFCGSD